MSYVAPRRHRTLFARRRRPSAPAGRGHAAVLVVNVNPGVAAPGGAPSASRMPLGAIRVLLLRVGESARGPAPPHPRSDAGSAHQRPIGDLAPRPSRPGPARPNDPAGSCMAPRTRPLIRAASSAEQRVVPIRTTATALPFSRDRYAPVQQRPTSFKARVTLSPCAVSYVAWKKRRT